MITGILKTIMSCSGLSMIDIYMLLKVLGFYLPLFEDHLEICLDMKIQILDDQIIKHFILKLKGFLVVVYT